MDQNGTYTRLTCTKNDDGSYAFTVPVDGADVYIVLAYKGDVDLNGRINTKDANIVAKRAAEKVEFSNLKLFVGDTDMNGRINTKDANICAKVSAVKSTHAWNLKK